jgi:hypothetical protein
MCSGGILFRPSHVRAFNVGSYTTRPGARQGVIEDIERFDNGRRKHSKLGDVDPQAYEAWVRGAGLPVRCA